MILLAAHARAATLDVTVQGVRNDRGAVRVALCTKATFLKQTCEHVGSAPAQPGDVTIRVDGVPPGVWAAQAFHDENDNGTLDTTLLGMPAEGLGFANDAKMRFGPPSFADAAVQVTQAGGRIRFTLRYY